MNPTANIWRIVVKSLLILGGAGLTGLIVYAWLLPIEYFQQQALNAASGDSYRQFEAAGRAEAGCWSLRVLGPVVWMVLLAGIRRSDHLAAVLQQAWIGFLAATCVRGSDHQIRPRQSFVVRVVLLGWLAWSVGQWVQATDRALGEWPYYRFRSGIDVLPNISDANRDVIRYVLQATPADAKILVASDQKLFFLSYYLRPRRIYHRLHPDSEFVIPLAHQQRRLPAYQLSELDPNWIRELQPDFVLEYFEHPEAVDRESILDDERWIAFLRARHRDPKHIPSYYVRLWSLPRGPSP